MEFSVGKKVLHAYTREPLWVLRLGHEQVLCRTQDLREIWFYKHELVEIDKLEETRSNSRFL